MDKITYTIVEKKGETFDTFRFGGFNLSLGKTLAQSFVDTCAADKALAGGFYVTCAALVDIARKCGFLLSSAVIDCVTNPAICAAFDAVCAASDKVATIKRQLARAKKDAERLAYIPATGLGGTVDERKAREKSLMAALVDTREYINSLSDNLTMAQEDYKKALAKLTTAERAYYEANAKKNAKKSENNNNNNENNNN